jgi:hypothetical protein
MASRSPPPSKRGRREDEDDESCHRKKFGKGKEPTAKEANKKLLFDDTKFAVELLWSAFRKLEGIGEAFDNKVHHDVYKDPSVKAEKLENLPAVKRAARRHFLFDDGGSDDDDGSHGSDDGDDGSHGNDGGDDDGTPTN